MVEDQSPIHDLGAVIGAKAKVVRGYSFLAHRLCMSFFEDHTDLYWARSRVLEYSNGVSGKIAFGKHRRWGRMPPGSVGFYRYALVAKSVSLAALRSLQDWTLRYRFPQRRASPEVASVGGFVKQYQVVLDPRKFASLQHLAA